MHVGGASAIWLREKSAVEVLVLRAGKCFGEKGTADRPKNEKAGGISRCQGVLLYTITLLERLYPVKQNFQLLDWAEEGRTWSK
jgi:hypothetical protein